MTAHLNILTEVELMWLLQLWLEISDVFGSFKLKIPRYIHGKSKNIALCLHSLFWNSGFSNCVDNVKVQRIYKGIVGAYLRVWKSVIKSRKIVNTTGSVKHKWFWTHPDAEDFRGQKRIPDKSCQTPRTWYL